MEDFELKLKKYLFDQNNFDKDIFRECLFLCYHLYPKFWLTRFCHIQSEYTYIVFYIYIVMYICINYVTRIVYILQHFVHSLKSKCKRNYMIYNMFFDWHASYWQVHVYNRYSRIFQERKVLK